MKTRTCLWAIAVVFASFFFSARPASATPGWSTSEHITEIQQQQGVNGAWVFVDSTVYNDICSGSPGTYFLPDDSYSTPNTKWKSQFSMLMAAYMQGKLVNFYISGCSPYGNPMINVVQIN
jgi:hypothetical protein